jgi:ribosomal protein S27AE
MDEYEFEELVADIWEQRGWETSVTTGSSDRGIDVIAEKSSPFTQKQLIQAKRYSVGNKIGSPSIQQYSSLRHQEGDVDAVVVVTTSSFSSQAKRTAEDLNVKLIDGTTLAGMIIGLDSMEFLSKYVTTNTQKEPNSKSEEDDTIQETSPEWLPKASTGSNQGLSSDGTSKSSSNDKYSTLPDNFEKDGKTTELGRFCPLCGGKNTIWNGKTVNTDPMLVCGKCGTKWSKKVKNPLLFGSKQVWWEAIGKDMKKEPSEWKDMNPNRSR